MSLTYPLVTALWHDHDEFAYQAMEILLFSTKQALKKWLIKVHSGPLKWSTDLPLDKKVAKRVSEALKELVSQGTTEVKYDILMTLDVSPGKRSLQVFHTCFGSMIDVQHEEFDSIKEAIKYIRKNIPKEARDPEDEKYAKEYASCFVLLYWNGQGKPKEILSGVEFELLESL